MGPRWHDSTSTTSWRRRWTIPRQSVPAQWPAARGLQAGDALTCEVSASFWDYTGQLLRTFAVAAEPSPLYRELHDG